MALASTAIIVIHEWWGADTIGERETGEEIAAQVCGRLAVDRYRRKGGGKSR